MKAPSSKAMGGTNEEDQGHAESSSGWQGESDAA
jgi:hypothetical protein